MIPATLLERRFALILPALVLLSALTASAFPAAAIGSVTLRFEPEPTAGRYLVASESMADPRFRRTVILIIDHNEGGTLGIIINRPGIIPAATLGEGSSDDALRFGGPVEPRRLSMLFRAPATPAPPPANPQDEAAAPPRLLELPGKLRFVLGRDAVFDTHSRLDSATPRRIFAGYAGWGPGQLASELRRDDWHLIDDDPSLAFSDEDPAKIWTRLIRKLRGAWI